ncbi:wax ester/triacylglycerol synthase domain-containing protein [Alteromonas flava]|uniref:wax ester/triacylglycerol synthase domain-containing protein n=1 Tax=Alteromonas flava TaxID=2048003 RepID=UPI000C28E8FE|nr:wax ester/triacylglycerol synthase domain-containing protein [Alteromonas flava]
MKKPEKAKTLTFLDKTFWITESVDNPKHVASLQLLKKPQDSNGSDYVDALYQEVLQYDKASNPFNCRVKSILGFPVKLQPVKRLDMHYHVQIHVIEDMHDRQALDDYIAKMHEVLLDRDKPLWQFHFIHDGKSDTYGIYVKVHHMYGDGATLVRWFQEGYHTEKTDESFVPVWAVRRKRSSRPRVKLWRKVVRQVWSFLIGLKDLLIIFIRLFFKIIWINRHYMPVPFSGTRTVLTGQVKSGRAVATMDIDFERVRQVGKKTRASANEILLCVFDIGIHRFLQDYGHTFEKALFTNMPINLRKPGEQTSGNKIAIVPVELAHGKTDPYVRLRQIIANHRIVKQAAQHASPGAFSYYTVVIQSFALIFEVLRLSNVTRPIANLLVSNVPGPAEKRYLKDSELLANYPVSTMTPGGGVNITLMTYNGVANIGMVCCNKNIKSLQPLADYCSEAFDLLEKSIDDPTVNIEDMGEHFPEMPVSIVTETLDTQDNKKAVGQ